LAYYAHLRAEGDPSWAKALDTNPRVYMRKGLRFLHSDASLTPETRLQRQVGRE
jgi:hypothetical protein